MDGHKVETLTKESEVARGGFASKGLYLLPSLFTLSALFFGFYAVICASQSAFLSASMAIVYAMIMDGLDGRVARLTRTQTQFGAELDSLSDMVSFGVAPAFLMHAWCLQAHGQLGSVVAFVYAAAVALRLARFNSQQGGCDDFSGAPCPIPAACLASFVWFSETHTFNWLPWLNDRSFLLVVMPLLALLMISSCRYPSFKTRNKPMTNSFLLVVFLVTFIACFAMEPAATLLLSSVIYICLGPLLSLGQYFFKA
tara:strand:- start:324 stop:1088 length:765 start_codon:yes stop_codon:yes gene_type:complete